MQPAYIDHRHRAAVFSMSKMFVMYGILHGSDRPAHGSTACFLRSLGVLVMRVGWKLCNVYGCAFFAARMTQVFHRGLPSFHGFAYLNHSPEVEAIRKIFFLLKNSFAYDDLGAATTNCSGNIQRGAWVAYGESGEDVGLHPEHGRPVSQQ